MASGWRPPRRSFADGFDRACELAYLHNLSEDLVVDEASDRAYDDRWYRPETLWLRHVVRSKSIP